MLDTLLLGEQNFSFNPLKREAKVKVTEMFLLRVYTFTFNGRTNTVIDSDEPAFRAILLSLLLSVVS